MIKEVVSEYKKYFNVPVNIFMAHVVGLDETIIYSTILIEQEHHAKILNNGIYDFFPFTVDNLEKETTLSEKRQRSAISNLVKLGLIYVKILGVPGKRHFKIINNFKALEEINERGIKAVEDLHQQQEERLLKKIAMKDVSGRPINIIVEKEL